MLPLRHQGRSRRGRSLVAVVAAGAVTAATMLLGAAPTAAAPSIPVASTTPQAESDSGLWLVRLAEPSLAAAAAADQVRATNGHGELDVAAPDSLSYLEELAQQQDAVLAEIETLLGRPVEVAHSYRNVVNGLAIEVDAAEAAQLTALSDVVSVEPDEVLTLATAVSQACGP